MSLLKDLRERHTGVRTKLVDINKKAESEDRSLTESESTEWDSLIKESDDLEKRIKTASFLDDTKWTDDYQDSADKHRFEQRKKDKRGDRDDPNRPLTEFEKGLAISTWLLPKGRSQAGVDVCKRAGLDLSQREIDLTWDRGTDEDGVPFTGPSSIAEARAQRAHRREMRKVERERNRDGLEGEFRQQSVGTDTAGGFTVPDEMMAPMEVALLQFGSVRRTSTILTTATGADLPIPTNNDTATKGEIIDENTAVNDGDLVYGQIVLGAYKYSSKMVKISVELLQDSATNMPAHIGSQLGIRIGRIHADHFTTGTGTGQPNGILTAAADSGVTAASQTAITYDELLTLKHSVDPAYREGGQAGWMVNDAMLLQMKLMKDLEGRPLWMPSLITGEPDTFDGDMVNINQSMPAPASAAKAALYGALGKYWIRDTRDFTLLRLDERFAELHQVAFLAFTRNDGDLIDAGTEPVKYLTMAT